MHALVRTLWVLSLSAYAAAAVLPCDPFADLGYGPEAASHLTADDEAHAHQEDTWCQGASGKPAPFMSLKCPCGCGQRQVGLAGPSSLDHALLSSVVEPIDSVPRSSPAATLVVACQVEPRSVDHVPIRVLS